MNPRVLSNGQHRHELSEVVHARPGKKRNVDRKIEQHRPARNEAEYIAQPAHDEVLPAARNRIGCRKFGVGKTDTHVHDAAKRKAMFEPPAAAPKTSPSPTNMSAPTSE